MLVACGACAHHAASAPVVWHDTAPTPVSGSHEAPSPGPGSVFFPLALVEDVELPGGSTRFDHQVIDSARHRLIVAHVNDASVLVLHLDDGTVEKVLQSIPAPRGVAIGGGRIFVTSSPSTLLLVDAGSLESIARVPTGRAPTSVAYDRADRIVAVSDERDGALSLIADAGSGARVQVPLGRETGNVVFDARRGAFWAAVVAASPPDQLVQIDPVARRVVTRIDLPGCAGAHGVQLKPSGQGAFVACHDNNVLVRVDFARARVEETVPTGGGPHAMAIDPELDFLYVAAESGDLVVYVGGSQGLVALDHERPGDNADSVAVDPATHRVFFPLMSGPHGRPVLRIMRPLRTPEEGGYY
jgi:YVTN family beta-propeller protein